MFTNDKKFRDSGLTTERRKAIRSECENGMKEFGVSPDQVIWMGGSGHYVPEGNGPLETFGARAQVPENCVIFSDEGNAFFRDGQPVIPHFFRARTATYPPIVHHYISPNDNRYHGVAKAKWRAEAMKMDGEKTTASVRASSFFLV